MRSDGRDQDAKDDAGTASSGAGRRDQRRGPNDPEEDAKIVLQDISRIPSGARQKNAAAFSSSVRERQESRLTEQQKETKKEAERLRRIALWDAQKVLVGGVEMTNAQVQAARREVIANGDAYARRAVEMGHIHAGEEDAFKDTVQRMHDLKDAERENGSLSKEQQHEWDTVSRSRLGRAADAATASAYKAEINASVEAGSTAVRKDSQTNFPSAPLLNTAFGEAASGQPEEPDAPDALAAPKPNVRTLAQPSF